MNVLMINVKKPPTSKGKGSHSTPAIVVSSPLCLLQLKYCSVYLFIYLGKTTLADALVASNGIISQRMAGKVCGTNFRF